ncbi:MAG: hypothetical protein COA44_05725 [Arcobacter sp.]|nr:MAG: hypothetical protein COA44_05725 [Arcobacter sp.]
MNYPNFFDTIPSINLQDPLSAILGTFEKGELEISYLDVIKGSGHSCPTVSGAYLMTFHALKALFPEGVALRGSIKVDFKEDMQEGTTGVVSNVISYITGATDKSGFKGLNGKFARHSLMSFNQDLPSLRFTRTDTNKSVDVFYDPTSIKVEPRQMQLMKAIMQGSASQEEKQEFGELWQDRVKRILVDNFNNVDIIRVIEV